MEKCEPPSNLAEINPQQNLFEFEDIKFDSRFDSGNLLNVINPEAFKVFIPSIFSLICGYHLMEFLIQ